MRFRPSRPARPCVTVVVPAYNAARMLGSALDSVARQTYGQFDVVVVDDGSTDDTAPVAETRLDRHRMSGMVLRQPNRGQGSARNRGIAQARGDLIAFLDADDIWYPDKLDRMVTFLRSQPPEVGLVCHNERVVDHRGRATRVNRYGPASATTYRKLLLRDSRLSPSAVLARREVLEAVGGFSEDPRLRSVEDYDLWLRLSRVTRFAFLPEVLGEYRQVPGSSSGNVDSHLRASLDVLDLHFSALGDSSLLDDLMWQARIRKRKQVVYRHAARRSLELGDRPAASANLKKALRVYPFAPKAWALLGLFAAHRRRLLPDDAPPGTRGGVKW